MKVKKWPRLIMALAALALVAALFQPSQASAASSYLRNNNSISAPACGAIDCPYGPGYLVRNGTGFTMYCWADSSWRYGNGYWTNRWFKGWVNGLGVEWVPSNYVMNQTRVGHC